MDEGHIAVVEKDGKISLPKPLLAELGIYAGDYLYVGKEHGSIVLLKVEQELGPSVPKIRKQAIGHKGKKAKLEKARKKGASPKGKKQSRKASKSTK